MCRVLNAGDVEAIESAIVEVEDAVAFIVQEEDENTAIGQLAAQVLDGVRDCLGFEVDDEDGDPVADTEAGSGGEDDAGTVGDDY